MSKVNGWMLRALLAAATVGSIGTTSLAVVNFTGGNGIAVFGVTPYGAPAQPTPTYIANNFTGFNDILTSPGNGFLTTNPVIANNIASNILPALPAYAFQVGGSNGTGNFGAGIIAISGPGVAFTLADANPDGAGAASYEIGSWNATYTNTGALNTTYGGTLGIAGHLTDSSSAIAVALRTHISDTMGVFGGGGTDLPQLVLAAAGNPNGQALGGANGLTAGLYIAPNGNFYGLAFDNLPAVNIPDGDVITVTSTLTAIGDPADLDIPFSLTDTQIPLDMLNPNWGDTTDATSLLPGFLAADSLSEAPEPATLTLLAAGATLMFTRRRRA